jgi:membrane-associated phospholipid phosphatase
VHWPTDVIGGWLLAATLVALAVSAFDPLVDVRSPIAAGRRLPDRPL